MSRSRICGEINNESKSEITWLSVGPILALLSNWFFVASVIFLHTPPLRAQNSTSITTWNRDASSAIVVSVNGVGYGIKLGPRRGLDLGPFKSELSMSQAFGSCHLHRADGPRLNA